METRVTGKRKRRQWLENGHQKVTLERAGSSISLCATNPAPKPNFHSIPSTKFIATSHFEKGKNNEYCYFSVLLAVFNLIELGMVGMLHYIIPLVLRGLGVGFGNT